MIYRIIILFFIYHVAIIDGWTQIRLNNQEAEKAYIYLNEIRKNPRQYADSVGLAKLKRITPTFELKQDPILQKVAEEKALDMAKNKYFSHTNKNGEGINILMARAGYSLAESAYKNKRSNYFESISAGPYTGRGHIDQLIIDEGVEPPSHRNHLLGLDEFWGDCTDIGIGYVEDLEGKYGSYMVVIIAKAKK